MISRVEVLSGYAAELPAIKGKVFEFTPGINVLFSPNGSGKSSLLNIIAGYTLCSDGGWSKYHRGGISTLPFGGGNFPDCMEARGCKANVEWDGTPCFYNSAAVTDSPIHYFGQTDMSFEEEVGEIVCKPSDGQKRLHRINKMAQELNNVPDLTKATKHESDRVKEFAKYVKTLSRKGPVTLLMDEPERSLSIESQALVWAGLPNLVKKYQIIVATHSHLPLLKPYGDINFIDMEKGYSDYSKKVLDFYFNGKPLADLLAMSRALREADSKIAEDVKEVNRVSGEL